MMPHWVKITWNRTAITSITFLCILVVKFSNGVIFTSKVEKDSKENIADPQEDLSENHRLIDALEIDPSSRFGFLVVVNIQNVQYAKCTGSLLNNEWAITAAHCLGKKEWISEKDCGSELLPPVELSCKRLENGDLKINVVGSENRPKVYIGMHNMIKDAEKSDAIEVDYIIRPSKSYPGGNYGSYGGYDVILLKLKKKANKGEKPKDYSRICLPDSEKFNDLGHAMVAGYGRYRRAPCEVGRMGPEKFEYCGTAETCTKGSKGHQRSNCTIQWKYQGSTIRGCSHDPTPSASDKKCQEFIKKTKFEWPDNVDEVALVDESSNKLETTCYRENPGSYGWCGTVHHRPQQNPKIHNQHIDVRENKGWGFCQRSCYPQVDVALGGIERFKTVDVLEDDYCETTIAPSLKYKPKVLCIAFNFTHRTSFVSAKSFDPIDIDHENQLKLMNRKHNWYVTGTGLCLGDSGGPLFKTFQAEDNSRMSVLIGIVSRGTGSRGNCGGLDNATHYVRIKDFLDWIMTYIKKDDLCFFKQSSDLSGQDGNSQMKEIKPNELFKKHINDDEESQARAEEDIKNADPRK